ncbi:response regulator transcription factor [Leekyejoonella antrihumi]|uniref:Response regulator transcription factor n=1 Tax=Leekyejoonella antrihumi TaxID=1660198 RepID=A0A563DU31_9MICO|nr:response regulator transcription factor [Leekyejoonella antrihumi]
MAAQAGSRGDEQLSTAAEETRELCERLQVEIADLLRHEGADESPDPLSVLTERESEVARLIARDHPSNAELAASLHISEKTVKTHVSNILRKLDISQRSAIGWLLQSNGEQMSALLNRTMSTTKS